MSPSAGRGGHDAGSSAERVAASEAVSSCTTRANGMISMAATAATRALSAEMMAHPTGTGRVPV